MAIAHAGTGSNASTETSGAALSPLCPATVNAGDILVAHVFWESNVTAPSTPGGWTLLYGPALIETTVARHWVFGKIADGSEDSGAVAFGAPAVTTQRAARVYSFSGRVGGAIADLVKGFAETSHATDPQMPSVTTTQTGALACALVGQNDNNAFVSPTGESGGDWVEAVAELTAALTPGLSIGLCTCTPTANPGTVSGGNIATTNDPCGVIGFQILAQPDPTVVTPSPVAAAFAISASSIVKGTVTILPSAALAAWGIPDPVVTNQPGGQTVTPTSASAAFAISVPVVTNEASGQTVSPTPVGAAFTINTPTVVMGTVVLTPAAASALFGIAAPLLVNGAITITPNPAIGTFTIQTVQVQIPGGAGGATTRTLAIHIGLFI